MVIKASSSKQINPLVADLGSDRTVTREAAIANLRIIGARAIDRVATLAANASAAPVARVAALRVLETAETAQSLDIALGLLNDTNNEVAIAAIGVAGLFVRGPRGVSAVDRLTTVTLDVKRADVVRIAALRTLAELSPSTLKPLYLKLRDDRSPTLAAIGNSRRVDASSTDAKSTGSGSTPIPDVLPGDPETLKRALAANGNQASLTDLHRLITQIAERERTEPDSQRMRWMTMRGAAHLALANRRSRLALYDLRETLEAATQAVPVDFLAALQQIGDASCLEPIAAAFSKASKRASGEEWWRRHLLEAFHEIVTREKITRRHAVLKRIEKRWPSILHS